MKKPVVKRHFPSPAVSQPPVQTRTEPISEDKSLLFRIVNELNATPNVDEDVPHIAFTYWEGKEFSYLHLLTVQSLAHYNPDLTILIYSSTAEADIHSTWTTKEHAVSITNNLSDISLLRSIKNVQFVKVNMDAYVPGLSNMSCIYQSDVLRVMKLQEHGGIWFDFDILFFRPIPPSLFRLRRHDIGIFKYEGHIAIGFIFSHSNNPILTYLGTTIRELIEHKHVSQYQSLGALSWGRLLDLPIISSHIQLLPNDICYSYTARQVHSLYNSTNDVTTKHTIGIHWYNGSPLTKTYINNTNFQNIVPARCVMDKYIHRVLQDLQPSESKEPSDLPVVEDDSE